MNVKFDLAGDLALLIEGARGGTAVNLTVYRGVCYEHKPGEVCPEVKADTLFLQKQEARAIASAMMGCAAEL